MRKWSAIFFSILLVLSLSACGQADKDYETGNRNSQVSAEKNKNNTGSTSSNTRVLIAYFTVPEDVKTYLDVSLKRFDTVFPAVGSAASAIELTCDELERCCGKNFTQWVDVCKGWQPEEA